MNIFISWSGVHSKKVAEAFKELIKSFFRGNKIKPFLSAEDIPKGDAWFKQICENLQSSSVCIVVLTSRNIKSQWLNFEAGAIAINAQNEKLVCPFLWDIKKLQEGHPLNNFQVTQNRKSEIKKLLLSIKRKAKVNSPSLRDFDDIFNIRYKEFENKLSKIELVDEIIDFCDPKRCIVFPDEITKIEKGKLFIGAPMDGAKNYPEMRDNALGLEDTIKKYCGILKIYYPGENIHSKGEFEGEEYAMIKDFKELKSSEFCIFIYPYSTVTSILLEIGYAIALGKSTIIFTADRKDLPFILREADRRINFLNIYQVRDFNEIIDKFKREKETIFEFKNGKND